MASRRKPTLRKLASFYSWLGRWICPECGSKTKPLQGEHEVKCLCGSPMMPIAEWYAKTTNDPRPIRPPRGRQTLELHATGAK